MADIAVRGSPVEMSAEAFKANMIAVLPQLRAFARNLCGDYERADDLVQDTLLKAWAARDSFQPGTYFRAWTLTILRNHYYSQARRNRFVGDWDDAVAERVFSGLGDQEARVALRDLTRALQELPAKQREALILVGAGGMAYEEVAEITGAALGTVKSRVSRGRAALEAIFASGQMGVFRADFDERDDPATVIMAAAEQIFSHASRSMTAEA